MRRRTASEGKKLKSKNCSGHKRKCLPKVVYNLLSDRDLKKKLKEHGLSSQGTRQQLIKRHQEFVHMHNAQCDSLNPKSVAEIVKELENNEKTRTQLEFNKAGKNSMTFTKDQTEKEMDEIHTYYRNKHKGEFQLLVDQVNNRWKKTGKRKIKSLQEREAPTAEDQAMDTGEQNIKKQCTDQTFVIDQLPKAEIPDSDTSKSYNLAEGSESLSPAFSESSGSARSISWAPGKAPKEKPCKRGSDGYADRDRRESEHIPLLMSDGYTKQRRRGRRVPGTLYIQYALWVNSDHDMV
ncbi:E3 ubiquitin-protein ligase RAD18 [Chelonia mydas]|uniref:E3 ubiquitin-protein ligase RAD18 n=1 Tax=Chelonia mydas TaxID=8469 RepID=M7BQP5_CHEMY|nr:E3 ubiquitin-protein ligase RAD18 [Chelonia mydas]